MKRRDFVKSGLVTIGTIYLTGCKENLMAEKVDDTPAHLKEIDVDKVDWKAKTDEYWKSVLSDDQFAICRKADTERPFSGKYCLSKFSGSYACACCGQVLFQSDDKFESGTGWPSFTQSVKDGALTEKVDSSHGMVRTEVLCGRCGAHLGHVFDDGPPPSHKRFCINSLCLFLRS